jgi:ketosteroid isomerase-like protein
VTGGPASFFGPDGESRQGAEAMLAGFETGASHFGPESESTLEIFESGHDGKIGFWTGLQHATVQMKDGARKVSMTLRITEIFRVEDGEWKLFHRHADMAASKKN